MSAQAINPELYKIMRNILPTLFLLALFCLCLNPFLSFNALAQETGVEYNWEEKRNRDGIVIYTSKVEGSPFKAVRGVMTVTGKVESLVALVEDLPACPDWAAMCKEARLISRDSPTRTHIYVYNDIPFPVSDRDVYALTEWEVKDNGTVSMTSSAQPGGVEETRAVRLVDAITQWHFTDQGDGTVQVENYAHIDPNGPTPAWITNMLLVDSPFDSMTNMRKLIESGAYADAKVAFLSPDETAESDTLSE